MRHIAAAYLIVTLFVGASAAQDDDADGDSSLIQDGARMFLRGILEEMEPALDGLQSLAEDMRPALNDFVTEMGPALRDLLNEVEDWSAYDPPVKLPNGDIILRRKVPLDPFTPDEPLMPGGEIEL
ncbi:hypothetical protein [Puniceibacterium sp. IMCC21224]|uniref:hypothetical protein n=1 Tax=Puniceibacterium sp. IMCC21224 TaxID=1618204 RepID=UPI00064DD906|nr:hypothetical protein [Puniceibacterium sp. IMCC21224]KMK67676.1 hypothetical protein IMCC21224_112548 [Puniceibacterium sp. IMCC21224]